MSPRSLIIGLAVAAAPSSVPAFASVYYGATGTVTNWTLAPGAGPGFTLDTDITLPGETSATNKFNNALKNTSGVLKTLRTVKYTKAPDWGNGRVDYSGTRGGFFGASISMPYTLVREASGPGVTVAQSLIDPFTYTVGSPGSDLQLSQDMFHGTQLQRRDVDPNLPVPTIGLRGRAGIGPSFSQENPATLWPGAGHSSAPAGADDLFNISVFENSAGQVDAQASINPFSSNFAGFSQSYNSNADLASAATSIRSMIVAPQNWAADGNFWTLNTDLHLFDYRVMNDSASNVDQSLTIGVLSSQQTSVPEPTTGLIGLCGVLATMWRRRRGRSI